MKLNMIKTGLAASTFLVLAGASPAFAQGMQESQKIPYEFSFQYDQDQMTSRQDVQATKKRLRAEATRYCRELTSGVKDRSVQKTCVRKLVRDVNIEMAEAASNRDRYAAR
ncbi:MAG: UrcA family protein [Pseudomonadota bacterium]